MADPFCVPPFAECRVMRDETTDFPDRSFDLVISVEVLEHVGDVTKSAKEISRLLAPGRLAVLTTPCANRFSIEWFYNVVTGGPSAIARWVPFLHTDP
jgi:2-polyprenyl-3-methyl-5-hydroxy-6-metoxy-1,4-benzoquinol methylase